MAALRGIILVLVFLSLVVVVVSSLPSPPAHERGRGGGFLRSFIRLVTTRLGFPLRFIKYGRNGFLGVKFLPPPPPLHFWPTARSPGRMAVEEEEQDEQENPPS